MDTARHLFRKRNRLLTSDDFQSVFRRARRRNAPGLTIYFRRNVLGYPRLGLAIPRRCARRAVARNRIKRVIRERFRQRIEGLGSMDIVFLGRPGLDKMDKQQLRTLIDAQLTEIERCERS